MRLIDIGLLLAIAACSGTEANDTSSTGSAGTPDPPTTTGSISIAAPLDTINPGETLQFTATLGGIETGVRWSASAGQIDETGLYEAPWITGTVTITATSTIDETVSASKNIALRGACPGADDSNGTVVSQTLPFSCNPEWPGPTFNVIFGNGNTGCLQCDVRLPYLCPSNGPAPYGSLDFHNNNTCFREELCMKFMNPSCR